jgi:hypothetical protein
VTAGYELRAYVFHTVFDENRFNIINSVLTTDISTLLDTKNMFTRIWNLELEFLRCPGMIIFCTLFEICTLSVSPPIMAQSKKFYKTLLFRHN